VSGLADIFAAESSCGVFVLLFGISALNLTFRP
jgi:hypothetical protein